MPDRIQQVKEYFVFYLMVDSHLSNQIRERVFRSLERAIEDEEEDKKDEDLKKINSRIELLNAFYKKDLSRAYYHMNDKNQLVIYDFDLVPNHISVIVENYLSKYIAILDKRLDQVVDSLKLEHGGLV